MSDRLTGILTIVVALAFFAGATQLESPFFADPLGPRTFPMIVSGVALLAGAFLVLRPDPEAKWPPMATFLRMGLATVILILYALTLRPAGFIIPTALAAAVLSYQLEPRALRAAIIGPALAIGLFVIFKYFLGLGLFAFPRGWFG